MKYGWATKAMFSFKTKEATYGATVTNNSSNFFALKGAKVKVAWPDNVSDDGGMITGSEYPTDQEIMQNAVTITITEDRAHPAFVAAAMALSAGSNTPTQDTSYTAYRHKAVPMAAGTAMPSINAVIAIGGGQYLYKGLIADSVKISGTKGGYVQCELVLKGSGVRTTDASSFVAWPSESWLKVRNIRSWIESGANIAIDATPTQGLENISSATPTALASRFQSFEFSWSNSPEFQIDNIGVDHGKRVPHVKFQLVYNDTAELTLYENQANLAFEVDLDSGTIIAAGGAMKYGLDLIIPRCRIKAAPLPDGGVVDKLMADYEVAILDDGTNPPFQCYTFNAISAFIA